MTSKVMKWKLLISETAYHQKFGWSPNSEVKATLFIECVLLTAAENPQRNSSSRDGTGLWNFLSNICHFWWYNLFQTGALHILLAPLWNIFKDCKNILAIIKKLTTYSIKNASKTFWRTGSSLSSSSSLGFPAASRLLLVKRKLFRAWPPFPSPFIGGSCPPRQQLSRPIRIGLHRGHREGR